MKKKVFNLVFISLSAIILLIVIISTQGFDGLMHQLANIRYPWIAGALICMLLYWGLEAVVLHIITTFLHEKQKTSDSFKITMIGQFFNSITPFATGGQPAQLYAMIRDGVEAGHAGSILMIKFIVFQTILTIYSLIIILLKAAYLISYNTTLFYWVIIGFLVHTTVFLLLVFFSYSKSVHKKLLVTFIKLLKRFRIIKDAEKMENKFKEELANFHAHTKILRNNIGLLVKTSVLTILQFTCFFLIPYFVFRAFGMDDASLWNLIAVGVFVSTAISAIPLPGGTIGAEGGFVLYFRMFFDNASLVPAMLIWRIITYYSCIGIGGLFTVLGPHRTLKRKRVT